jgi:hypothetical protein
MGALPDNNPIRLNPAIAREHPHEAICSCLLVGSYGLLLMKVLLST